MIPSTDGCSHPDPTWTLSSTDEDEGWHYADGKSEPQMAELKKAAWPQLFGDE